MRILLLICLIISSLAYGSNFDHVLLSEITAPATNDQTSPARHAEDSTPCNPNSSETDMDLEAAWDETMGSRHVSLVSPDFSHARVRFAHNRFANPHKLVPDLRPPRF